MGSSEESESYRLQMLRRLENKYSNAKPAKVREAEKVIAQFREEEARERETIARLRSPLPEPDLCPECWFLHANLSKLYAVPADDPKKFDRMKCGQCGYSHEWRFRHEP